MPWYLGNASVSINHWRGAGIGLLALWSLVWTGLSLWHAAKREDKGWFIFFLFFHTAGIIEFIYLMFVAKVFTAPVKKTTRRRRS